MKRFLFLVSWLLLVFCVTVNTAAETELKNSYMTLKDTAGRLVTETGHQVVVGDEYLTSENRLYRIYRVTGKTAYAKLVKKNGLQGSLRTGIGAFIQEFFRFDYLRAEVKQRGPIGVYHTHTDESYEPTDGTSSKPAKGGIIQVGDTLTKSLEMKGIPVVHSKTPHDPHDGTAYDRSRRTAVQLLRQSPVCLIDVHRDAGPLHTYSKYVDNQAVTKVQLVLGRQNPNFQANNDFAKKIKAVVDKKYHGFIKGIYYGEGKYNQDLGQRTILLEFGTEKNSQQAAERGADIFAAAASEVLYGTTGTGFLNRGSMRSLFWIIVALVGGVGLFLLINRGSLKDLAKEFTGAVGENINKDKNEPDENKDQK